MHWKIYRIDNEADVSELGPLVAEMWAADSGEPSGKLMVYDHAVQEVLQAQFGQTQIASEVDPDLTEHFRICEGDRLRPWAANTLLYITRKLPKLGFVQVDQDGTALPEDDLHWQALAEAGIRFRYGSRPGALMIYRLTTTTGQALYNNDTLVQKQSYESQIVCEARASWSKTDELLVYTVKLVEGQATCGDQSYDLANIGQTFKIGMKTDGEVVYKADEIAITFPGFPATRLKTGDVWKNRTGMPVDLPNQGPAADVVMPVVYANRLSKIIRDNESPAAVVTVAGSGGLDTGTHRMRIGVTGTHCFEFQAGYLMQSDLRSVTEAVKGDVCMLTTVDLKLACLKWSPGP